MKFSSRLRKLLKSLHLTQSQFCSIFQSDRVDSGEIIAQETVSKWLRGVSKPRNVEEKIEAVVNALCEPGEWFGRLDKSKTKSGIAPKSGIALFPPYDPQDTELWIPDNAVFPGEFENRQSGLRPLIKNVFDPIMSEDDFSELLERCTRSVSEKPFEEVVRIDELKARAQTDEAFVGLLMKNSQHGSRALGFLYKSRYRVPLFASVLRDPRSTELITNRFLPDLKNVMAQILEQAEICPEDLEKITLKEADLAVYYFILGYDIGANKNGTPDGESLRRQALKTSVDNIDFQRRLEGFEDLILGLDGFSIVGQELDQDIREQLEAVKAMKIGGL